MSFFDAVDKMVAKYKTDLAEVKSVAKTTHFVRVKLADELTGLMLAEGKLHVRRPPSDEALERKKQKRLAMAAAFRARLAAKEKEVANG